MQKIKNQLHFEPAYSSQVSLIALEDDADVQLATVLLKSLSGTQLPELEQIDKIIFKMRFSMASERHSEQEWKIINGLYSEVLAGVDIRDLTQVSEDYLSGVYSEFMPKPTSLAKKCQEQKVKRENHCAKISLSLRKHREDAAEKKRKQPCPKRAEAGRKMLEDLSRAFPSRRK